MPNVDIPPDIILPLLLPPLLYASAQRTSWRQFAANRRPIFLLAVALVFVTTAAVAAVANAIVPGLPIAAAVALGALVAPPDPVAATAVAGPLGLPRRLVSILEGEGLFNDVTAIVLYHVAIAAAVSGTFSRPAAGLSGAVRGGRRGRRARARLGDQQAHGAARRRHAPGGADAAGAVRVLRARGGAARVGGARRADHRAVPRGIRHRRGRRAGPARRPHLLGDRRHPCHGRRVRPDRAGAAQRRSVRGGRAWARCWAGRAGDRRGRGRSYGCSGCCPPTWLAKRLHNRRDYSEELPASWRETVVMWWAGMRGVATVALALAIPLKTDDGKPFPGRDEIVFIAFAVIAVPWSSRGSPCRGSCAGSASARTRTRRRHWNGTWRSAPRRPRGSGSGRSRRSRSSRRRSWSGCCDLAYDVGARISPEMVDEDRREAYAQRAERLRAVSRIQREMMSAARHAVLSARSETGSDPEVVDRVLRQLDVRSLR